MTPAREGRDGPSAAREGALVGFGGVAEHGHVPGYEQHGGFRIGCVAEPDPTRRERARQRLGPTVRVYPGLHALLAEERPAFVDITTPPDAHPALMAAAAAAGRPLLVEKPLAVARDAAAEALAAAAAVPLLVVHNWHHAPVFRAAADAVREGAVGRPTRIRFETERTQPAGGPGSWRLDPKQAGGGILMDHGWHQLYLARALLDAGEPARVSGRVERRRFTRSAVEDTARVDVRFAGGARAELRLTWAGERRRTAVRLEGDGGALRIEDGRVWHEVRSGRSVPWPVPPDAEDDSWHAAWFPPLLDLFARACRAPEVAAAGRREAWACQATLDAAYRSAAADGSEVAVDLG